jgi:hypothetical protein
MTPALKNRLSVIVAAAVVATIVVVMRQRNDEKPSTSQTTEAPSPTTTTSTGSSPPPALASASASPSAFASAISSGQSLDLSTALAQTNKLNAAKAKLAAGDAKGALVSIEEYDTFPEPRVLKEEMTVVKITALSRAGRKADALALAISTRDDPAFEQYRPVIDEALIDAGLRMP